MNITQLKADVKIPALVLQRQLSNKEDATKGQPTEWMSHWEDAQRLRISMLDKTYAAIKEKPERNDLVVSKKVKETNDNREGYTILTIMVAAEVVDVL